MMINTTYAVIPDTQAILLLCGYFGGNQGDAPLKTNEYNKVARWLHQHKRRPADLLNTDAATWLQDFPADGKITGQRISQLLARGIALGFEQERWAKQGIWVLSRADSGYPEHMRKRLGASAPVLLYGAGNQMLLKQQGIAVVGGRDADNESLAFAKEVANQATFDGFVIISGGARGVDSEAVSTALDMNGSAIVVVPEGIAKSALSKQYRSHLAAQRLALISPFVPQARWNAGNAMGRNKIVYALSELTIVASSGLEGGTWEGATENLKANWVPTLVRSEGNISAGNKALLQRGAIPCPPEALADLNQFIVINANLTEKSVVTVQQSQNPEEHQSIDEYKVTGGIEVTPPKQPSSKSKAGGKNKTEASLEMFESILIPLSPEVAVQQDEIAQINTLELAEVDSPVTEDLFHIVWPILSKSFQSQVTESDLVKISAKHSIQAAQLKAWLSRAIEIGVVNKLVKPIRYQMATRT